jgi:hypothetical protein
MLIQTENSYHCNRFEDILKSLPFCMYLHMAVSAATRGESSSLCSYEVLRMDNLHVQYIVATKNIQLISRTDCYHYYFSLFTVAHMLLQLFYSVNPIFSLICIYWPCLTLMTCLYGIPFLTFYLSSVTKE